jgi:hypothetical protein
MPYADIWIRALDRAIKNQQWAVVSRLWRQAAERYPPPQPFWDASQQLLSGWVDVYLSRAQHRTLADTSADFAAARSDIQRALNLSALAVPELWPDWRAAISGRAQAIEQELDRAQALLTQYRQAYDAGDWLVAIERLTALPTLDIVWDAQPAQSTLGELLAESRSNFANVTQAKFVKMYQDAEKTSSLDEVERLYAQIEPLLGPARDVVYTLPRDSRRKDLEEWLEWLNNWWKNISQTRQQLEEIRQLYDKAVSGENTLGHLHDLAAARHARSAVRSIRTGRSMWRSCWIG